MNILVLAKRFSSGKDCVLDDFGREIRLSEELQKLGNSVTIMAADYHKHERKQINLHGMNVKIVPYRILQLPFYLAEATSLAKKAQVIIAMGDPMMGALGYIVSSLSHKPLVYDIRDNYKTYSSMKKPGVSFFEKMAIKKAAAVTLVSYILASRTKSKHKFVLGNGVNTELFRPIEKNLGRDKFKLPKNGKIISYMGGSSIGMEHLITVFNELLKTRKNFYLLLIGNFSHIKGKNIITLQPIPYAQLPYAIGAVDVLVIPYTVTPFTEIMYATYKLVEFMACNKPIVCTDVGEMKKLLTSTPDLVAIPGDDESLKKALVKALTYKKVNYRKTLNEKGLTWPKLGYKLNEILKEVTS